MHLITPPLTSKKFLTLCSLAMGLALTSQAAVINWGTATTISGDTDVSLVGSFSYAYNMANTTAYAINGVTFSGTGTAAGTYGSIAITGGGGTGFGTGSGLSTNYANLLSSEVWNNGPYTLTLNALTIGNTYAIQVWAQDARANTERQVSVNSVGGTAVQLDVNVTNLAGGLGQYSIGSFVADNTSQSITFTGIGNTPYLGAIQLRDISSVPEPGSFALLAGAGCLCFVISRRSRNRQI